MTQGKSARSKAVRISASWWNHKYTVDFGWSMCFTAPYPEATVTMQPKNQKVDKTPDKNGISTLPSKPLTPQQEEKVKGGLASSEGWNGDGDGITAN